jgi:subtilase family serine protease
MSNRPCNFLHIDMSVVKQYRTVFGLSDNLPNVVIDGQDPGQNGAVGEAYLDVEAAGSVAPNATVTLHTSADTTVTSGLLTAALRAVDDNTAGVLSLSYGECEQMLGDAGDQFFSLLWQQAVAQGQTVFVSSGDGGAAGCDNINWYSEAQIGLAVNGFAGRFAGR